MRYSTELKVAPSSADSLSSASTARGRSAPSTSTLAATAGRVTGTERVAWDPGREAELVSVSGAADGMVRFWDLRSKPGRQCTGAVAAGGEGFSVAWRPPWAGGDDIVVGRKVSLWMCGFRRDIFFDCLNVGVAANVDLDEDGLPQCAADTSSHYDRMTRS